jgi:hypothetical protein
MSVDARPPGVLLQSTIIHEGPFCGRSAFASKEAREARTMWFRRFAAPMPVGPAPMTSTSTLLPSVSKSRARATGPGPHSRLADAGRRDPGCLAAAAHGGGGWRRAMRPRWRLNIKRKKANEVWTEEKRLKRSEICDSPSSGTRLLAHARCQYPAICTRGPPLFIFAGPSCQVLMDKTINTAS